MNKSDGVMLFLYASFKAFYITNSCIKMSLSSVVWVELWLCMLSVLLGLFIQYTLTSAYDPKLPNDL